VSSGTSAALVLRTFDYGETSQILHLFTREEGRVHGIAKGARRLKGAFRGGIDVLVLGRARIYARRGAAELRVVGGFDVEDHFPGLHARIGRFHAAAHVAAILLAFTTEEQPNPELFDLSVAALRLIGQAGERRAATDDGSAGRTADRVSDAAAGTATAAADRGDRGGVADALATGFEAMALRSLGFGPELGRCVLCDRPAKNIRTARLSALRGGLLCSGCRNDDPKAPELTGAEVAALRILCEGPLVRAPQAAGDPAVRRALRDALDRWSETFLDRPLRTARRG
jgi:DNA repair protein RecO (recombination protein O)